MNSSKNKTCPFMQGHWGCIVKFLCENFKYFVIGGSIILAAIAYGCFSKTAKDNCYYKNYRMKYQELKKINPNLDKWSNKAEASRFALKACNIK